MARIFLKSPEPKPSPFGAPIYLLDLVTARETPILERHLTAFHFTETMLRALPY